MKSLGTTSVLLFCLGTICCFTAWADDATTSITVHHAGGNPIGSVDPSGQWTTLIVDASNEPLTRPQSDTSFPSATGQGFTGVASTAEASPYTIDTIRLASYSSESYSPTSGMVIANRVTTYSLSDGSSWSSGAGSSSYGRMRFQQMEMHGADAHFHFTHDDLLLRKTDYDSGNHSANFELHVHGPLVIVAPLGSQQGVLEGQALIVSDEPANYNDSRFNYLSAIPGSAVTTPTPII